MTEFYNNNPEYRGSTAPSEITEALKASVENHVAGFKVCIEADMANVAMCIRGVVMDMRPQFCKGTVEDTILTDAIRRMDIIPLDGLSASDANQVAVCRKVQRFARKVTYVAAAVFIVTVAVIAVSSRR